MPRKDLRKPHAGNRQAGNRKAVWAAIAITALFAFAYLASLL